MDSAASQSVCFDNGIFGKNGFDVVTDFENWFLAKYKQKTEVFIESFREIIKKNSGEQSSLDQILAQNQTGFGGTTIFIDHQLQELKNACDQTNTSNILDVPYKPTDIKNDYEQSLSMIDNYFKKQLPVFQFAKLSENDLNNPELRSKKIVMQLLWEYTWLFKCASVAKDYAAMVNHTIPSGLRSEMFFNAFDMETSVDDVIHFLNNNHALICKAILKCKKSLFFTSMNSVFYEWRSSEPHFRNGPIFEVMLKFLKDHSASVLASYYVSGKVHPDNKVNTSISTFLKTCRPTNVVCTAEYAAKCLYQFHRKEIKDTLSTIKGRAQDGNYDDRYTFNPNSDFYRTFVRLLEAYRDQEKSLTFFFRDALFLLYDPALFNSLFSCEFRFKILLDYPSCHSQDDVHVLKLDTLECFDEYNDAAKINFIHKTFFNESGLFLWIFYCKYCLASKETREAFLTSYSQGAEVELFSEIKKVHTIFLKQQEAVAMQKSLYGQYESKKKAFLSEKVSLTKLFDEQKYEELFIKLKSSLGEPFEKVINDFLNLSHEFLLSAACWQSLLNVCEAIVKDPFLYLLFSKKIITCKDVQEVGVDGVQRLWLEHKNELFNFKVNSLLRIDKKLRTLHNEIQKHIDSPLDYSATSVKNLYSLIDAFENRFKNLERCVDIFEFYIEEKGLSLTGSNMNTGRSNDYSDIVSCFLNLTLTDDCSWCVGDRINLKALYLWNYMKRDYNFKDFFCTGDFSLLSGQIKDKISYTDQPLLSDQIKDKISGTGKPELSDLGLVPGGGNQGNDFLKRVDWLFNKKYAMYGGTLFIAMMLLKLMHAHYSADNDSFSFLSNFLLLIYKD
ncbi:hypothetical protein IPH25_01055 [bacterium]|nr:MAG: hypothetical protein IPG37_03180 [bacterium]QQR62015.1 MAG: hypothetical protein IPH25_01055 [bacterium]QQR62391.1 MAG: hypothetical protein IPH67_03090 [bacterium]